MTDLKNIKGIGKVKADKLIEAGIADAEALAAFTDEQLAEAPYSLKAESIASLRELIKIAEPLAEQNLGNGSQDPDSAVLPEGELLPESETPTTTTATDDIPDAAGSAMPALENPAPQDFSVQFKFFSGQHKNRVLNWAAGNPSARFSDGLYVSLGAISIHKRPEAEQKIEGEIAFNVTYGNTTNGASLPSEDFAIFSEAVIKKLDRRLPQHRRLV